MKQNLMEKLAEDLANDRMKFYEDDSEVEFTCVQCGQCCHDRDDILLSPFDLYNIVRATGKTINEVVSKYGDRYVGHSSHLPLIRLKYREDSDGRTTCYFLGQKDGRHYCRIQEYKPCVCRIYPFGKVSAFQHDKNSPNEKMTPKYFLQDFPEGECLGHKFARANHVRHTLLDWVGGKEKKHYSDLYSEIFNEFAEKFHATFNFEVSSEKWSDAANQLYYAIVAGLMYYEYDFTVDEESFLEKMKENLESVIELNKYINEDSDTLLRIAKKLSDNGIITGLASETA